VSYHLVLPWDGYVVWEPGETHRRPLVLLTWDSPPPIEDVDLANLISKYGYSPNVDSNFEG